MSNPPLQSNTRPEFTIDGQVRAELTRDLTALQIEEDIHGMKKLHATFVAIGPREGEQHEQLNWLDGQVLDFGKTVEVAMGASESRATLFSGKLSALELSMDQGRAPEVCCMAEDSLMELRLTHRFKTYENASEADMVQYIAAQHGLSADCDIDTPTWPLVQQWNQSDLAFLRERARRHAAEIWVEGSVLHLSSRANRNGDNITLIQGNTLISVTLRADLAHQRSSMTVSGFDDAQQQSIDEQADSSEIQAEAQGHTHGAEVLQRAYNTQDSLRVRDVPLKDDQARSMAKAALLQRARRFVTVSGVADGNTQLKVGTRLRLERVSALFEGDGFYVTRTRHQFDLNHGYRTHFDAERIWIGS